MAVIFLMNNRKLIDFSSVIAKEYGKISAVANRIKGTLAVLSISKGYGTTSKTYRRSVPV
jgi:hypothetical protein